MPIVGKSKEKGWQENTKDGGGRAVSLHPSIPPRSSSMESSESHAGTACLLLGLSGMHGTTPTGTTRDVAADGGGSAASAAAATTAPPSSMADASSIAASRTAPAEQHVSPAAVAAALMAAIPSPTEDGGVGAPSIASAALPGANGRPLATPSAIPSSTTAAAWSSSGSLRRLQVSALPRKEWSAEEDSLIRSGVERLGCRWRVIAAQLPGRSDDAVRNRWSRLQEALRGGPAGAGGSSGGTPAGSRRASKENGAAALSAQPAPTEATEGATGDRASSEGDGGSDKGSTSEETAAARCSSGGSAGGGGSDVPAAKPRPVAKSSASAKAAARRAADGAAAGGGGGGEKKERTSWTRAEDDVIMRGVAELGHKWYEIARRLPGRTDHAIRNRWSRLQSILGMHESALSAEAAQRVQQAAGAAVQAGGVLPPTIIRMASDGGSGVGTPVTTPVAHQHPVPPPPHMPAGMMPPAVSPFGAAAASRVVPPIAPASVATVGFTAIDHQENGSTTSYVAPPAVQLDASGGTASRASVGSEGSDPDVTNGTAELLLLQSGSGGSGNQPPRQASPHLAVGGSTGVEKPKHETAAGAAMEASAELLLLNKRPRV